MVTFPLEVSIQLYVLKIDIELQESFSGLDIVLALIAAALLIGRSLEIFQKIDKVSRYVCKLSCRFSLFNRCSCFSFASFSSLSNLSLYLLQMPIKGVLFVLIGTFLVIRSSTPIKCVPSGFKDFQPLMTFIEAKDTGLLGFYALYTPKKPRKLERCQKLWCKRSLILMLLLLSGIESNPGEF